MFLAPPPGIIDGSPGHSGSLRKPSSGSVGLGVGSGDEGDAGRSAIPDSSWEVEQQVCGGFRGPVPSPGPPEERQAMEPAQQRWKIAL